MNVTILIVIIHVLVKIEYESYSLSCLSIFLGSEGGSSKEEVTRERETKEEEEPG